MLTHLKLVNFKNFRNAELRLGPFSLLIGANAAGKSNLRDAFRFLHGISRGYSIADIIGEKWGEGGELLWKGIRGGTREIFYGAGNSFSITAGMLLPEIRNSCEYQISVTIDGEGGAPRVTEERFIVEDEEMFKTVSGSPRKGAVSVKIEGRAFPKEFDNRSPILSQIREDKDLKNKARQPIALFLMRMKFMRFFELDPEAMRRPSIPGQTVLGDKGENLSSVLQAVCLDRDRKSTLLEWLRALTPMDAHDFEFPQDQSGRILVTLVERAGTRVSAASASDGTLRFLSILCSLLATDHTKFIFFEELENGIHPTRLHLLTQLIEQQVREQDVQVVASTHSPELLGLTSDSSREASSVIYRLEDQPEARIRAIGDLPMATELLERQGASRLFASGWFEDVLELEQPES